ncbi:MAG: hypothetical protein HUU54_14905 [Ignavibacteriaceae bacterium]|nr:hypothetical protein [Ignavibacteriaceae bacterium]
MLAFYSAILFSILILVIISFQIALAAGKPWGEYAMGGKYPGRFPLPLRIGAVIQAFILLGIGLIVLIRAKMILSFWYSFSETAIWFVAGFTVLGTVLNLITPSKKERMIWGPVSILLLISSLIVAFS